MTCKSSQNTFSCKIIEFDRAARTRRQHFINTKIFYGIQCLRIVALSHILPYIFCVFFLYTFNAAYMYIRIKNHHRNIHLFHLRARALYIYWRKQISTKASFPQRCYMNTCEIRLATPGSLTSFVEKKNINPPDTLNTLTKYFHFILRRIIFRPLSRRRNPFVKKNSHAQKKK